MESNIAERVAVVEQRLCTIEASISDIRDEQDTARRRDTTSQVDMGKLIVRLEQLVLALAAHETWHKENTGAKFSLSNIVLSVCSLLVLIANLIFVIPQ